MHAVGQTKTLSMRRGICSCTPIAIGAKFGDIKISHLFCSGGELAEPCFRAVPAVQHFLSSQRLLKVRNIAVEPYFRTGINVGLALNGFNGPSLMLPAASEARCFTLMTATTYTAQDTGSFYLLTSAASKTLCFTLMTAAATVAPLSSAGIGRPLAFVILFIRSVHSCAALTRWYNCSAPPFATEAAQPFVL